MVFRTAGRDVFLERNVACMIESMFPTQHSRSKRRLTMLRQTSTLPPSADDIAKNTTFFDETSVLDQVGRSIQARLPRSLSTNASHHPSAPVPRTRTGIADREDTPETGRRLRLSRLPSCEREEFFSKKEIGRTCFKRRCLQMRCAMQERSQKVWGCFERVAMRRRLTFRFLLLREKGGVE